MTMLYYVDQNGATQGPMTPAAMLNLWRRGVIHDETPTALEGDVDWLPLTTYQDVLQPPKRVRRVNAPLISQESKKGMHWAAQLGVILTVIGLGIFAFANIFTGGITAALGLLMVIAFK